MQITSRRTLENVIRARETFARSWLTSDHAVVSVRTAAVPGVPVHCAAAVVIASMIESKPRCAVLKRDEYADPCVCACVVLRTA